MKMGHSSHRFIFCQIFKEKKIIETNVSLNNAKYNLATTNVWRKEQLDNAFKTYMKAFNKSHQAKIIGKEPDFFLQHIKNIR